MKVRALDWTEGNVGHVHLRLDGGDCRVDWGDGHTAGLKVQGREWVTASHMYPESSRKDEDRFVIIIFSDSDNITGILICEKEPPRFAALFRGRDGEAGANGFRLTKDILIEHTA